MSRMELQTRIQQVACGSLQQEAASGGRSDKTQGFIPRNES